MDRSLENTFVIEVCENCRTHNWNTRHDENKYRSYAMESKLKIRYQIFLYKKTMYSKIPLYSIVASKIQECAPGSLVLINEVPKAWVDYEIYCQLIPNTDTNLKTYKILPRIGSFEVSFKGVVRNLSLHALL